MTALTDKQRYVLYALAEYTQAPSCRQLADRLQTRRHHSATWSYREVHGHLTRLYRRGLVERWSWSHTPGGAIRWQITSAGRYAIESSEDPS